MEGYVLNKGHSSHRKCSPYRLADTAVFPASIWTTAIKTENRSRQKERTGTRGWQQDRAESSTQGHAERRGVGCLKDRWRSGGSCAAGPAMFPIRAASFHNCLIGGCVWDGGGSRARVFPPSSQLVDIEARLPPSRLWVLVIGSDHPISPNTKSTSTPPPSPPLTFPHWAHYVSWLCWKSATLAEMVKLKWCCDRWVSPSSISTKKKKKKQPVLVRITWCARSKSQFIFQLINVNVWHDQVTSQVDYKTNGIKSSINM